MSIVETMLPAGTVRSASSEKNGTERFVLLERVAGMLWFAVLAMIYLRAVTMAVQQAMHHGAGLLGWTPVLSFACSGMFYAILGWLMMQRPAPVARQRGLWPVLIAFLGTYAVWLMPLLPAAAPTPITASIAAICISAGSVLIIVCITHLGRSFSIAPQARALVTSGPYRLVRHPLYLAEEIAVIGVLMQFVWWAALVLFTAHLAFQLRRMLYEEEVLGQTFPDYAAYAGRTARLIPGLW